LQDDGGGSGPEEVPASPRNKTHDRERLNDVSDLTPLADIAKQLKQKSVKQLKTDLGVLVEKIQNR
jgi:hypothetical protein